MRATLLLWLLWLLLFSLVARVSSFIAHGWGGGSLGRSSATRRLLSSAQAEVQGASPSDAPPAVYVRRKHKNKYEQSSLKNTDPLVQQREAKEQENKVQEEVPLALPEDASFNEIGRVLGPHGIKGELKVELLTDFADLHLRPGNTLYLSNRIPTPSAPTPAPPRPVKVVSGRRRSGGSGSIYLLLLEAVSDRSAASSLMGHMICSLSSCRPALGDDEYIVREVVGCDVFFTTEPLRRVAVVEGVVPPSELCGHGTAAAQLMHSLLEIRFLGTRSLLLVPFVDAIVPEVDVIGRRLTVCPPEGMLDQIYSNRERTIGKARTDKLIAAERKELDQDAVS